MHTDRQEARIGQELSEKFKFIMPNFAKDGGLRMGSPQGRKGSRTRSGWRLEIAASALH